MNNSFERTFENLTRRIKGRTFITCESREIYDRLLTDAKEAGFEIPEAYYDYWDIVSINMDDRSLGSGGTFFHMQFYGSADVYRVDYGKYIRGEADFIYHGERLSPPEKYEHAYIKSKFFGKVAVSGKNNKKAKEYYLGNNGYLYEPDDEQFLFTQIERMFKVLIITDDKFDLTRAHRFSCNHKPELEKDSVCGCFTVRRYSSPRR